MRVMMIVKATKKSEAGELPSQELLASMGRYNQELMDAGVLIDLAGLKPTSKGARIRFSGGKTLVIDGPFAETRELVAGFWIIRVKSKEEAIEWARRIPPPHGDEETEVELRPFYELEDFAPGAAVEQARGLEEKIARKK